MAVDQILPNGMEICKNIGSGLHSSRITLLQMILDHGQRMWNERCRILNA